MNLDGIPMRLVDTAGIRESQDVIERAGIERTQVYLERADLLLVVVDGSSALSGEDEQILKKINGRQTVLVINKIDLPLRADSRKLKEWVPNAPVVKLSASQGAGLDELVKMISMICWKGEVVASNEELVTNVRHREALVRTEKALERLLETMQKKLSAEFISVDLHDALDAIGEIVGETTTDDLLGRIFSKFCIGK
jgi:tRNA modification GTPase